MGKGLRGLFVISCALLFMIQACAGSQQTVADGGGDGATTGCSAASNCSEESTLDKVCVSGDCLPLDGELSIQKLGLSFIAAPEIASTALSFVYYAIYPEDTSGDAVACKPLIEGTLKPESASLNLVQSNALLLGIIKENSVVTATKELPALDDYVLYGEVLDKSGAKIGVCCRTGAKIPSTQVGLSLCPSDKAYRCLTGGTR